MAKAQYGSDVVVDLMQRFGIESASLNPGSSFRGLHDSIVNYGQNNPKIITCQHEEIAIQIAHGYARVTGPMDVNRRRPHIDWTHTALVQGNAVRDFVRWDDQPFTVDGFPDSFAR